MSKPWLARVLAASLVPVALGACLPASEINKGNPLGAFMDVLTGHIHSAPVGGPVGPPKKAKVVHLKNSIDVTITGSIGGLDGTYDLTIGSFGEFSGIGKIGKDRRSATVTATDTDELKALVHAVILSFLDTDVVVTTASAKVVGKQTTGGVKKSWNGAVTFKGYVNGGDYDGRLVKGKLTSKGTL